MITRQVLLTPYGVRTQYFANGESIWTEYGPKIELKRQSPSWMQRLRGAALGLPLAFIRQRLGRS